MKEIIIVQRFTFTKEEKLKSRKLIQQLFKEGLSFSLFPFRILCLFADNNHSPLQTGFAVSAKNFKKAVDRNRIKRLMREAYRLNKQLLTDVLKRNEKWMLVFFIYTGNALPDYDDVVVKMQAALKRLNKIADEKIAANS